MIDRSELLVFFGSQTGNAEWIAKNINEVAINRGFKSEVNPLNEFESKIDSFQKPLFIFVTSTTGDGKCIDDVCTTFLHICNE